MGPGQETGPRSHYPDFDRSLTPSIGPFPASPTPAPASSIHTPPEPHDSASPSFPQGSRWHRQYGNVPWLFLFICLFDGHLLHRWAIPSEAISGAPLMDRPVPLDGSAHWSYFAHVRGNRRAEISQPPILFHNFTSDFAHFDLISRFCAQLRKFQFSLIIPNLVSQISILFHQFKFDFADSDPIPPS
jgi:hypothetical protein